MPSELPFDESRRLTGSNLYFDGTGVALETLGDFRLDAAALAGWHARLPTLRDALGWPHGASVVRRHASGASLAFAAPLDQLYTAVEANEWAWLASLHALSGDSPAGNGQGPGQGPDGQGPEQDPPDRHALGRHVLGQPAIGQPAPRRPAALRHAPAHPAPWDQVSAFATLAAMAAEEANPDLVALLDAARARAMPAHADDDVLSIGEGTGHHAWPVRALPAFDEVPWQDLHAIPLAVVTGSNGKTTSVRLLAAMARANGWNSAYSSTDGLYVGTRRVDSGDYSGPVGARTVLRQPDVDVAILETARGGLLRRGLAISNARVAVVTNISPDHFGEYGIHSLDDLAEVKLTVARALAPDGMLVLNADDGLLLGRCPQFVARGIRTGWFALDFDHPHLRAHRHTGGMTCGVRGGHLRLSVPRAQPGADASSFVGMNCVPEAAFEHDLGPIAAMPVTLAGSAGYNIANAAAAALGAVGMSIAIKHIAQALRCFGAHPGDNPGRLQRWGFGDAHSAVQVFLDYAHNPDGLRGLLQVANATRGARRLGLILGQAGNREDRDIRALAAVAAQFKPDRVWLKDIGGDYMRGRVAGEIAAILRNELLQRGLAETSLVVCLEETRAARDALRWARAGDVLVLPIHDADARDEVVALLDGLHAVAWRAGQVLPQV